MVKLSKRKQIKRIKDILFRPEFITCNRGHTYLPMTTKAEHICPICEEKHTEDYDEVYDESIQDYIFYFKKQYLNDIID